MTEPDSARTLALGALLSIERRKAYADAALDGVLNRHPELAARERALTSQLVYGVLRWRNRLDAHIARCASRPLEKLHPTLLEILRLGTFQLLFLDRVPDRAAVYESVELARRFGVGHGAGLVNAVLRRVAEAGPDLELSEALADRLSLLFGCPGWLVELWLEEHGEEGAQALCAAASKVPTVFLRVSPRTAREAAVDELAASFEAGPAAFAPTGVWVEGTGDPRRLAPVERRDAVVQDQASQLVAHLVAPAPDWRVLDACSAPGLKATHLAELMSDRGEVLALDVHLHRVRAVGELARRLGLSSVSAAIADAREYRPVDDRPFDAVLVDAPCSGLGVLARTPEAKWRRTREQLAEFPRLQFELLAACAGLVRPGGVLVYATCTTVAAENEGVVGRLLAERGDFVLEPPPAGPVPWEGLVSTEGWFRTYPGCVGRPRELALDGFFGARLRRRS